MSALSDAEKQILIQLIEKGKPLPPVYKSKLFVPEGVTFVQATKEYRLVYDGKTRREEVIANTPEAPFQIVREFNSDNVFPDGWRNMLIYGDNLFALKELYADQRGSNRYGTRGRIKLIYIDPPFATRQDFMKDREKAYRDKVTGSQFIEFLRKRLILLREVLADDGSIFVHLDTKKGHYIKAVLDEIFDETNFRNEIIWKRQSAHNDAGKCGAIHDTILFYTKTDRWVWNEVKSEASADYLAQFFDQIDSRTQRRYARGDLTAAGITKGGDSGKPWRGIDVSAKGRHWAIPEDVVERLGLSPNAKIQEKLDALDQAGAIHWPKKGVPRLKRYADELDGVSLQDVWTDIKLIHNQSSERLGYPTQKPETLVERVIRASSHPEDIVLDAFAGSGTTAAVAEKLKRRWIVMDCGQLAIYLTQKRMFGLTTIIGSSRKDSRTEVERTRDFNSHLSESPSLLLITEKARKGECDITLELLEELAELIKKHNLGKKDSPFALVCPLEKLKVPLSRLKETEDDGEPGDKRIKVGNVEFRVSLIELREKPEKETPLKAKAFALYNVGVYDNEAIKQMPWAEYRPFVLKLFQVREHQHFIKGFRCDGYVGVHSAYVWNYPDHKKLTIDYDYVKSLHETLSGSAGEKFYIIAPIVSMGFAEDEYAVGKTTYVFLKVPISILMRLLRSGEHGALKQPTKEADVNEVIDAVGFDFTSQPVVEVKCKKERAPDGPLLKQYVIHLKEFRSKTLATDPEDFANFETFSMTIMDANYDGEIFKLSHVFWADTLVVEELKRLKAGIKNRAKDEADSDNVGECEQLSLRIPEEDFTGKQMMVIFCDRYGNEKKLVFKKMDFR